MARGWARWVKMKSKQCLAETHQGECVSRCQGYGTRARRARDTEPVWTKENSTRRNRMETGQLDSI